jgi:acyl dehydratase
MSTMRDWSTRAVNLPEHSNNPIHTDDGARAKGFPAALVAGTTVYAYLTHLPSTVWGIDWLSGGGATVRFHEPVLDGDLVECIASGPGDDGSIVVEALVGRTPRARSEMFQVAPDLPVRPGEALESQEFVLDRPWIDYGERVGDDCPLYRELGIAHPVAWLTIANRFFAEQLVTGSWIHVRSIVAHHAVARLGATVVADATVVDRFDSRAGRRAITDVTIRADGEFVARVEHEAVIELP